MDRRPESKEHGRFKRQKTTYMDSRSDRHLADMREASPDSDDDGGVKLDNYYNKSAAIQQEKKVKNEKEAVVVKPNAPTSRLDSEPTSKKRQRKEEDRDIKPNSYLAHEYEKLAKKESDPRSNPYLAHMYEEEEVEDTGYNGYSNGYGKITYKINGVSDASTLARLPRHKTTAAMAKKAENGPNNPFSGNPLSTQYFGILKTRRNLPVHAQR